MGCTSSSAAVPNETDVTHEKLGEPDVPVLKVDAPADQSLIPSHHTDQFGNEIDDETGGRVWSEAYYKARNDADENAVQRGKYFERSKNAFETGNKKEAKELSDMGKKHGELMEEANKRAVNEILNPQHLSTASKIDLHGLLVAEAVEATKSYVMSCIGRLETVEIITGAGHHSDQIKGAVIKPAIVKLCKDEHWKLDSHESNEGSFTLHVPTGTPSQL